MSNTIPLCDAPYVPRMITRIGPNGRVEVEDILLLEVSYSLYCNGEYVTDLHCMPVHVKELAVGNCRSRELLHNLSAIESLEVDDEKRTIHIVVSKNDPPQTFGLGEDVKLTPEQVHKLQDEFNEKCVLFRQTGAAHAVGLATPDGMFMFLEDIARHNALDKVIGKMLLDDVRPEGTVLLFSGRLASDMLEKVRVCGVKLLIAPGAPSRASVKLAEEHNVTLLAFVRPDNINIYTYPERIL